MRDVQLNEANKNSNTGMLRYERHFCLIAIFIVLCQIVFQYHDDKRKRDEMRNDYLLAYLLFNCINSQCS